MIRATRARVFIDKRFWSRYFARLLRMNAIIMELDIIVYSMLPIVLFRIVYKYNFCISSSLPVYEIINIWCKRDNIYYKIILKNKKNSRFLKI